MIINKNKYFKLFKNFIFFIIILFSCIYYMTLQTIAWVIDSLKLLYDSKLFIADTIENTIFTYFLLVIISFH